MASVRINLSDPEELSAPSSRGEISRLPSERGLETRVAGHRVSMRFTGPPGALGWNLLLEAFLGLARDRLARGGLGRGAGGRSGLVEGVGRLLELAHQEREEVRAGSPATRGTR